MLSDGVLRAAGGKEAWKVAQMEGRDGFVVLRSGLGRLRRGTGGRHSGRHNGGVEIGAVRAHP